jgi:hypothetical protein
MQRSIDQNERSIILGTGQLAVAARNATLAENSLKQSREQFQKDERPYIWIKNEGLGNPEFIYDKDLAGGNLSTGQILWSVHYTNYGKTPADNLISQALMSVGLNAPFRSPPGFPKLKNRVGVPTPPNKDDFLTVISQPGITSQRFNELNATNDGIRAQIRITYSDAYGGEYETIICLSKLASGAIKYCEGGLMH